LDEKYNFIAHLHPKKHRHLAYFIHHAVNGYGISKSLKIETFTQLKNRIPNRIVEQAIWGMLPKGVLGRQYYKRLYVYASDKIVYKKNMENHQEINENNFIKIDL
jgi:ribosomal protein L13